MALTALQRPSDFIPGRVLGWEKRWLEVADRARPRRSVNSWASGCFGSKTRQYRHFTRSKAKGFGAPTGTCRVAWNWARKGGAVQSPVGQNRATPLLAATERQARLKSAPIETATGGIYLLIRWGFRCRLVHVFFPRVARSGRARVALESR